MFHFIGVCVFIYYIVIPLIVYMVVGIVMLIAHFKD